MKRKFSCLLWMSALISLPLQAESVRYVSDDLFTYLHSGPSNQYRILGSVNAGDSVEFLQESNKGFTQIKDAKGRTGWINSKFVSTTPSVKERIPQLESKITELNSQLTQLDQQRANEKDTFENTLDSRQQRIDHLTEENDTLKTTLAELKAENSQLSQRMDEKQNDLLMRWFSYGGLVAGIGLVLGLILPHLVSRKPKRRNGWA